jgi:NADH-quinone oxidoreductase subunit C
MTAIEQEKQTDFVENLSSELEASVVLKTERRLWVEVDPSKIVESCLKAQQMGFEHLSTISAVDWLEEGMLELVYHLWSYQLKSLLSIKTKIGRINSSISSINSIWDTYAETCEREIHELFGIDFEGNSNLTPLFLEDWEGPPPFLKDFNWRDYTREEHYSEENPREKVYFEVKK